jgi:cytochrome c biogenesis protein CcdA/glutaredoxin
MGRLLRTLAALAAVVMLVLSPGLALASTPASSGPGADDEVVLTLFWGDGCPHCAEEEEWLADVAGEYPQLTVVRYEVWHDERNRVLLEETAAEMGFDPTGVPVTIIGERHWIGWTDAIRDEVEAVIDGSAPATEDTAGDGSSSVEVPFFGSVAVSSDSLVVSTLVIGFVDGVNPCSLWVISVLLAIVVRTGSRRRVAAIGGTFLLVTAAMYALYMAGIYSAMGVLGHIGAVQVVVAVVAGVFGLVSLKDYFAFKKGLSFTIPDSSKPGIYKRMRAAAGREELLPALAATVVLAVGVSLLETPCTAGFPVLWTGLLEAQGVGFAEAAFLFLLYMLPFLADELVVFGLAVGTMRVAKMQEKHGRLLKLVGGTMMLALAVTVLVAPSAMSDPLIATTVFLVALLAAAIVHLATRGVAEARKSERVRREAKLS